jgi:hypothetical protein
MAAFNLLLALQTKDTLFGLIALSMFLVVVLFVPVLVEELDRVVAQRRRGMAIGAGDGRGARGGNPASR